MTAHVYSRRDGSVAERLNLKTIRNLPVPLAPYRVQERIGSVLGALDDKIELNRRMNETFEEMARALFRAWFVDFDADAPPLETLHADIEGDLDPSRWEWRTIGDVASQRKVRAGDRDLTVLSAVASGELVRSDAHFKKRVYSRDTSKYFVVEQWDIAYNPSRINIGSVGMHTAEFGGAVSPVYIVVRPDYDYRWFLDLMLRTAEVRGWISSLASGSVRQSLSYRDFATIPIVIPPRFSVRAFNAHWERMRQAVKVREDENRTLASLRDTLLPRLISGELRVPDAERLVSEVT